jgi:hypothetical protein
VDGTLADYGVENNDVLYILEGDHLEYHENTWPINPILVKVKQVETDYDVVGLNDNSPIDIRIVVDVNSEIDTIKEAICEAFVKDYAVKVGPASLTLYFRSTVLVKGTLAENGFDPKRDYLYVEDNDDDEDIEVVPPPRETETVFTI